MPTAGGPNTLGESNLVFAYDTGDVKNSYKGQPTVNALGTLSTDLFSWVTTGNSCTLTRDTIASPVGNTPLKMVTTGNDPYTNTYNSTGNNIAAASSGQTWTISVWAKANQNTTGAIFHFGANSSGNYIDFNATGLSLTTEWTRYTYTRTFTDANVVAIQARLDGPDSFQSGVVVWWDGLQVEQKANATQFTTGTRSATQGLLPLIGNSTLNLTNMSFDSNAQMVFDGTNDYVDCGAIQPFDLSARNVTWEAVVKFNDTSGVEAVVTRWDNTTGMVWWVGRYPTTKMHVAFIINGGYYDYYSDGDIGTTAGYHHIVATLNGTLLSYYINGVLDSTDTVAAGTWTADPDPSLLIGAQNQGAAANLNGEIPITKIYNRALTTQEVRQNYQQYKTRFNLS
jgi:hypothetical protein